MKASELVGNNFFKGIIYGESGVGKTCLAASFPGPIEYWDFDGKISSAVRYLPKEQLDLIDVYQFNKLSVKERIPAFEKRTQAIDQRTLKGEPQPFKTLVLDSLTTFSSAIMEDYIHRSQLGIKRPLVGINALQDYQLYESHMRTLLTNMLKLDLNIVCLAHILVEKDETTGSINRKPLVKGQALPPQLPVWFEEVYVARQRSDGTRYLQTQGNDGFVARCQRGFPKEIPFDVKEIFK